MKQNQQQQSAQPVWLLSGGNIHEVRFCQEFRKTHDIMYKCGCFFSRDGRLSDEQGLRQDIYEAIAPYVQTNIQRHVEQLIGALKLDCGKLNLEESETTIHLKNGTYILGGDFSPAMHFCRGRLNACYREDAPKPELWLQFLDDLLQPEDILTLQEFMGYCLLPTTIAQKMLIITGSGGEGKSRVGIVMKALFGNACAMGSLSKVETNRFARADLEHLLVMVDDDLNLDALPTTNYIKSIITAETPIDLERKGQQSYQGRLHVRFMAFGNDTLRALHDRSNGFFRRQIILSAKPVRPGRVDDPFLSTKLMKELDGIFLWCLEGLERLVINNMVFTLSDQTRANLEQSIASSNNIIEFMRSTGYFSFDHAASVSSRKFYYVYKDWCEDNNLLPLAPRTFWCYLNQNAEHYNIRQDKNINIGSGKLVRGFRGIRLSHTYL